MRRLARLAAGLATALTALVLIPAYALASPAPMLTNASVSGTSTATAEQAQNALRAMISAAARAASLARNLYIVRPGDTLSKIAARYGTTWPALWFANRAKIRNPDSVYPGQRLSLITPQPTPAITEAAMRAIPKPPPVVHVTLAGYSTPVHVSVPASAAAGPVSGWSSYKSCVAAHESGDGRALQNPTSTASGWFGFLDTTWESVTHLPGHARDYSLAVQSAAFDKLYAEAGRSPWVTDGC